MNFLDILITSPQYFNKKSMGTIWKNLLFDIRGFKKMCLTEIFQTNAIRNMENNKNRPSIAGVQIATGRR